ncbi:hypothetical protein J7F03_29510 [Streptomyces sp. ISL-43]|uniref:hypothetical protein n=1 Tax=Streptomyces sp. ISL-43 TaxID=2819183 RepID=UPI001BEBE40C|nr:hypothetical protein [Streptomyces sp. ISL-43]MBT2451136.1 hypothetical protein [Streptomyces sp. ISL-43]
MIEQLRIEVEQDDGDVESLQQSVNALREDLLVLDVEKVDHPAAGPAPPGTRSAALDLANVLVVTLPAVTPLMERVLHVVDEWRNRPETPHRVVVDFNGTRIELSHASPAERRQLIGLASASAADAREEAGGIERDE